MENKHSEQNFNFHYKNNLGDKKFYECNELLYIKYKNIYYGLNPYLVIFNEEPERKTDVGFNIYEYIKDKKTNKFVKKVYKKDSNRGYRLPTRVIKELVNCESAIIEGVRNLKDLRFEIGVFKIDYFEDKTYLRLSNLNEKFVEYLKSFHELDIHFDVIALGQTVSRQRLLKEFQNELIASIKLNEPEIQKTFKKFEQILPFVLLGVDSTLKFEFKIDSDQLEVNKVDISTINNNEAKNLIELKRADQILFDKRNLYRNNTFGLSSEFARAIQQTNIQRSHLSTSSVDVYDSLSKSVLIIGNRKNEFDNHVHKELLNYNLSVVKYNNKDLTIMTYDQVLERIQLLIG